LTLQQHILVHQVHPVKLAVDIGASVVSNVLLWRRHLRAGLLVRYLSPPIGSALVLGFADIDRLTSTTRARYVLDHMPPAMVAIRLAGDTLMAIGAWRRRPDYIVLSVLVVLVGWSHGLLARSSRRPWLTR
jgi:hypothetical protein